MTPPWLTYPLWIAGALCGLALLGNFLRRPRPPEELEPNCPLTKEPVEFWTGPRTLFYFQSYWGDLPHDLAAHGYDVRVIGLPWHDRAARRRSAARLLDQGDRHLVVDPWTAAEFADLLKDWPPRSVTVVPPPLVNRMDRLMFSLHLMALRSPPLIPKVAGDPCQDLRRRIRTVAEKDWVITGVSS